LGSAAILGEARERVTGYGMLSPPAAMAQRLLEVTRVLQMRPIDWYAPPGSSGLYALTRYVLECTQPSDRVLVTWFDPQVFFYAERPFAGGQAYFEPDWHSSAADQALTIHRMQRQRVPVVLINASAERQFHKSFPSVYDYVQQHYREAARSTFGGDREYAVLVDRRLQPTGVYEPVAGHPVEDAGKLPCFR
jgi:hypothetical protein